MWGGMFSKWWSSKGMKPKTAISLLDKLMLWHNINQTPSCLSPHDLTAWQTHLHDISTSSFGPQSYSEWHKDLPWLHLATPFVAQHICETCQSKIARCHLISLSDTLQSCLEHLELATILTCCGAVPLWLFWVHEINTTNLKSLLKGNQYYGKSVCEGGIFFFKLLRFSEEQI